MKTGPTEFQFKNLIALYKFIFNDRYTPKTIRSKALVSSNNKNLKNKILENVDSETIVATIKRNYKQNYSDIESKTTKFIRVNSDKKLKEKS